MAVLNINGGGTLMDVVKAINGGQVVTRIAELLTKNSELLRVMPTMAANGSEGHRVLYKSSLPKPTWVKHNQGVFPSKSTDDTYLETFGRAEQLWSLAESLYQRKGGPEFKEKQVRDALLGMRQDWTEKILYSNAMLNPEQPHGIIPRYDQKSGPWGAQIVPVTAVGTASGNDQGSILIFVPGPETVHLTYPEGTPGGIQYTAFEKPELVPQADGSQLLSRRGHFSMTSGIAVEDPRYIVRIANIDASAMSLTDKSLIFAIIDAVGILPSEGEGAVMLMPRAIRSALRKQMVNASMPITTREVGGHPVTHFDNIPIYADEFMKVTESPIAA